MSQLLIDEGMGTERTLLSVLAARAQRMCPGMFKVPDTLAGLSRNHTPVNDGANQVSLLIKLRLFTYTWPIEFPPRTCDSLVNELCELTWRDGCVNRIGSK